MLRVMEVAMDNELELGSECELSPWELSKAKRRDRADRVRAGEVVPFYVAAIGIDRCFGGREEGGWWYDATSILQVFKVLTWKHGLARARELRGNHPTCPRGRGSVIGGTDVYIDAYVDVEDLPEETFGRPRYE